MTLNPSASDLVDLVLMLSWPAFVRLSDSLLITLESLSSLVDFEVDPNMLDFYSIGHDEVLEVFSIEFVERLATKSSGGPFEKSELSFAIGTWN